MAAKREGPAAFRRLCVETTDTLPSSTARRPAAFRRLCVETQNVWLKHKHSVPAAFRRLCVETEKKQWVFEGMKPAAFRRLCVETCAPTRQQRQTSQPPSGGCVLKLLKMEIVALALIQPPSGGCVLKPSPRAHWHGDQTSRLRAAVC